MSDTMLQPAGPVLQHRPGTPEVAVAKEQDNYLTLPAVFTADGDVITRWQVTPEQRREIAAGADLYLILTLPRQLVNMFGFIPLQLHAGLPGHLQGPEPPPDGVTWALPQPRIALAAEQPEAGYCRVDVGVPPGADPSRIGYTVVAIARDPDFRDCVGLPMILSLVQPVLMLDVRQTDGAREIHVKVQFAPRRGDSLQTSAWSDPVAFTFPAADEAAGDGAANDGANEGQPAGGNGGDVVM